MGQVMKILALCAVLGPAGVSFRALGFLNLRGLFRVLGFRVQGLGFFFETSRLVFRVLGL